MDIKEITHYMEYEKAICNNTIEQLKNALMNYLIGEASKKVSINKSTFCDFSENFVENIEQGTFAVIEDNSGKRIIKIKDAAIYNIDELENCLKKMRKKLNVKVDQRSVFLIERSDEIDFSLMALEGIYKNNHLLEEIYTKSEHIIYVSYFIPTGNIVKDIFTLPKLDESEVKKGKFSVNRHFMHLLQNPQNGSIFGVYDMGIMNISYIHFNDTLNFLGLSTSPLDKYQQYENLNEKLSEASHMFHTMVTQKDKIETTNGIFHLH